MAISETPLKDTILLMIKEQNEKGGLLGKKARLFALANRYTDICNDIVISSNQL